MPTYYYAVLHAGRDSYFSRAREDKVVLDNELRNLGTQVPGLQVPHRHERRVPGHVPFDRFDRRGVGNALRVSVRNGTFDERKFEASIDDWLHMQ